MIQNDLKFATHQEKGDKSETTTWHQASASLVMLPRPPSTSTLDIPACIVQIGLQLQSLNTKFVSEIKMVQHRAARFICDLKGRANNLKCSVKLWRNFKRRKASRHNYLYAFCLYECHDVLTCSYGELRTHECETTICDVLVSVHILQFLVMCSILHTGSICALFILCLQLCRALSHLWWDSVLLGW